MFVNVRGRIRAVHIYFSSSDVRSVLNILTTLTVFKTNYLINQKQQVTSRSGHETSQIGNNFVWFSMPTDCHAQNEKINKSTSR